MNRNLLLKRKVLIGNTQTNQTNNQNINNNTQNNTNQNINNNTKNTKNRLYLMKNKNVHLPFVSYEKIYKNEPEFNFRIIKDFNIKTKYNAMIIEPRKHRALEFVLNNFLENLGEDWSIIIFCSDMNTQYIIDILNRFNKQYQNRIKIIRFIEDNIDIITYNKLCFCKKTYDFIQSEMFIIFQTDSII